MWGSGPQVRLPDSVNQNTGCLVKIRFQVSKNFFFFLSPSLSVFAYKVCRPGSGTTVTALFLLQVRTYVGNKRPLFSTGWGEFHEDRNQMGSHEVMLTDGSSSPFLCRFPFTKINVQNGSWLKIL